MTCRFAGSETGVLPVNYYGTPDGDSADRENVRDGTAIAAGDANLACIIDHGMGSQDWKCKDTQTGAWPFEFKGELVQFRWSRRTIDEFLGRQDELSAWVDARIMRSDDPPGRRRPNPVMRSCDSFVALAGHDHSMGMPSWTVYPIGGEPSNG